MSDQSEPNAPSPDPLARGASTPMATSGANEVLLSVELTDRARSWASTMQGHQSGSFSHAHQALGPGLGPVSLNDRLTRELQEQSQLTTGATRASGAGDRLRPEEPDPYRTCFERDRDRILHGATAFRRLAGKTQVFIFPDDHQRTRLTHALEVAQIAVAISRALRLNEALTEAIALGHDCGHGPGGHASEDAFAQYLVDGFDHAVWGADVVLSPLNLCSQTLDGIRNHSWSRPAPSTPEGEVVSWADRIAYVCHDFEDALHAGVITVDALPAVVSERCGSNRSQWIRSFIAGVISGTLGAGHLAMTVELAEALAAFRSLNYERIYLRPESIRQGRDVVVVLQALVEHFAAHPERIPSTSNGIDCSDTALSFHASVSYVAGMTDRFACITAVRELNWDSAALPRGLDSRFAITDLP